MAVIVGSYSNSAKYEVVLENPTFERISQITAFNHMEFASVHNGDYEIILTVDGEKYNWNDMLETIEDWTVLTGFYYYEIFENMDIHDVITEMKELI